jgi:mRNA interferase MazF
VVTQGDIWLLETPNDKRRPVLIVSRNEVIPVIRNVVVAPVTSTLRSIPSNIPLGPSEGLDHDSVANFDDIRTVPKSLLTVRLGALPSSRHAELCTALGAMADC